MVRSRTDFSLNLSDSSMKRLKRWSNSGKLTAAINKGFCNSRKILFASVERNTNKGSPSDPNTSWARKSGKANKGLTFIANGKYAYFGNTVSYVKFLEEGTKNMQKRPAMWIALVENKTNIQNNIETAINEAYGVKK